MKPPRTSAVFAVLLALAATGATAHAAKRGAPVPRVHPKITGQAIQGRALHATHGRWRNQPRRYRYAWLECNPAGKGCHAIRRARARTYKLARSNVGHRIRVAVTASNRHGSTRALSRPTPVVVNPPGAPPPPPPAPPPPSAAASTTATPSSTAAGASTRVCRDDGGFGLGSGAERGFAVG